MAAAIVAAVVPVPAGVVERYYSAGVYAWLQPVLTGWSNRVGFALLDLLAAASAILVLDLWTRRLRRRARDGRRGRAVVGAVASTVTLVAAGWLVFLGTWGLNYRREPVTARVDFRADRVRPEAVEALAATGVGELNRLHASAHARPWPTGPALVARLAPAFERAQGGLGLATRARPGRPKWTLFGPYFRWAAVAGMTDPFFLEVMLTPDALPFEQPALLAHEWGHLAGYAVESDASFVGWLACVTGDDQLRYSAWLDLLPRALGGLPGDARRRVAATLGEGPRRDYRAIERRLARASPWVSGAAWRSYDRFLKAHRVAEGVASYDAVVRAVVGTRFEDGWRPVRPAPPEPAVRPPAD